MRKELEKLKRGSSTKGERKFMELCKKLHIPFKAKAKIAGREVDFVIGRYAIEIDGHQQDTGKNTTLYLEGYWPVHIHNWQIGEEAIVDWLKKIWPIRQKQGLPAQ